MRKKLASIGVTTIVAVAGLFGTAGPASAAGSVDGNGCRYAAVQADGLNVLPCITFTAPLSLSGTVYIWGTNTTSVNLCMQLLMVKDDGVSTFPTSSVVCKPVSGGGGSVSVDYGSVLYGDYVIHAWFTSPTYWDGGESARGHVYYG